MTIRYFLAWVGILVVLGISGCANSRSGANDFVKPSVAVIKFENRAPFPMHWDLGGGMKDVLVDRLMASGRFHVIERPEIDSILRELNFQHSGATRPQERAALGQIKNVQYLVKGTVTDFSHVGGAAGGAKFGRTSIFGSSTCAVMGIVLYVIDVQSGEIICSESLQETVNASDVSVQSVYKDVAFGGSVFWRTPLGQATEKVIQRAVAKVTTVIATRPWQPKIAHIQEDGTVILNGGRDRAFRAGDEWMVVEPGDPVVDPDTGDVIAHKGEKAIARLRIIDVQDRYSVAQLTAGQNLRIGLACKRIDAR